MAKFPYKVIDLTHTLDATIPTWDGSCGFEHKIKLDYDECALDVKFRVQKLNMHAGIGTHIDAPSHCIPGGNTVEQLSLNELIAACVMIDVSKAMHERYSLSVSDIEIFEREHGTIMPQSFVIIRTGWEQFWHNPTYYRNNHVFPSISKQAAEFLLDKRQIVGLGIDTLSPDRPEDGFPVHNILLGAGKYIIENIANAQTLPSTGSFSLALPIKTRDTTESPIRLIALVKEGSY